MPACLRNSPSSMSHRRKELLFYLEFAGHAGACYDRQSRKSLEFVPLPSSSGEYRVRRTAEAIAEAVQRPTMEIAAFGERIAAADCGHQRAGDDRREKERFSCSATNSAPSQNCARAAFRWLLRRTRREPEAGARACCTQGHPGGD